MIQPFTDVVVVVPLVSDIRIHPTLHSLVTCTQLSEQEIYRVEQSSQRSRRLSLRTH